LATAKPNTGAHDTNCAGQRGNVARGFSAIEEGCRKEDAMMTNFGIVLGRAKISASEAAWKGIR
jgi:hypothetical protein